MSATGTSPPHNDVPQSPPPNPLSMAQLAQALAESYKEIDSLKLTLAEANRRAERCESMLNAFNSANTDVERAIQEVRNWEKRARDAEMARDDEIARRVALKDLWAQLREYLRTVEELSLDARLGFDRIMDTGGGELVTKAIPSLSDMDISPRAYMSRPTRYTPSNLPFPIPQLPPLTGRVRQRADSVPYNIAGQPPTKRPRYQPSHPSLEPQADDASLVLSQASYRMARPPSAVASTSRPRSHSPRHGRHGHHSRSSSRSSNDSIEEMIREAAGQEGPNGVVPMRPGMNPPISYIQRDLSKPSSSRVRDDDRFYDAQQIEYRPNMNPPPISSSRKSHSQPNRYPPDGPYQPLIGPPGVSPTPTGVASTYQTHIFAPVQTGAPIKKGKPGGVGEVPVQGTVVAPSFPATNAEGQRICRQCGMAGRYKDGKCVEKWGPGPMGPGTVCDRCRKKMKRVERRGTLESQAQAAAAQAHAHAAAAMAGSRAPSSAQLSVSTSNSLSHAQLSSMREREHHAHLRRVETQPPSPITHSQNHRSLRELTGPTGTQIIIESSSAGEMLHPSSSSTSNTVPEESAMRSGLVPPLPPASGAESRLTHGAGISPIGSRPSSRSRDHNNGNGKQLQSVHDSAIAAPPPPRSTGPGTRPPSDRGSSGRGSMDIDADADADGDEASSVAVENDVEMRSPKRTRQEDSREGDPDQELLEAVDAAEANSIRSGN